MSTVNLGHIKKKKKCECMILCSQFYKIAIILKRKKNRKTVTWVLKWLFQLQNWYQNSVSLWKLFNRPALYDIFCVYVCTQPENTLLSEVMQWLTQQIILSLLRIPEKQPVQPAEPVLKKKTKKTQKIIKTSPQKTQTSFFGIKALIYYFVALLQLFLTTRAGSVKRDIDVTATA